MDLSHPFRLDAIKRRMINDRIADESDIHLWVAEWSQVGKVILGGERKQEMVRKCKECLECKWKRIHAN